MNAHITRDEINQRSVVTIILFDSDVQKARDKHGDEIVDGVIRAMNSSKTSEEVIDGIYTLASLIAS